MDASTPAAQSVIEIERHLRQLDDEWIKALVRRDGETLERIIADDFFFAYPLEGDDKAQFIADVTSGDLRVEHISREQVSVRVFGSTAVLTARDSATWLYHGRELSGQYKIIKVYSQESDHLPVAPHSRYCGRLNWKALMLRCFSRVSIRKCARMIARSAMSLCSECCGGNCGLIARLSTLRITASTKSICR